MLAKALFLCYTIRVELRAVLWRPLRKKAEDPARRIRSHERLGGKEEIKMDLMKSITQEFERNDIPAFGIGDTVRVHIKIKEGNRERIQVFEGFVLKRQNGGIAETFTVRKLSNGIGVEKTFPLHSPKIEKIEVVRRGDVRRAKLNYMRERTGKAAKIKSKEIR